MAFILFLLKTLRSAQMLLVHAANAAPLSVTRSGSATPNVWTANQPAAEAVARRGYTASCAKGPENSLRLDGREPIPMCLMPNDDSISMHVRDKGSWKDCSDLVDRWNAESRPTSQIFLEFGGNIGTCTLQVLVATNVSMAHVFEPNPEALFYFTSTMRLADAASPELNIRERLKLYPVAVGSEPAKLPIYTENDNLGNTVLENAFTNALNTVLVNANSTSLCSVAVVRADDVLPPKLDVGLLKMECAAVDPSTITCSVIRSFLPVPLLGCAQIP